MTTNIEELLRRMTAAERERLSPAVRPRDAATLILVDRSTSPAKVLLGKRHHGHKFMPGKYVFPGGRVEPLDRRIAANAHLDPQVESRLLRKIQRPSPIQARALVLSAIRETFEETGLLLGIDAIYAPSAPNDAAWADLATAQVKPDLSQIHFIARAITPPGRPRRFDTRFFSADASAITHRIDGVVGPDTELVELIWLPITEAKRLDMPAITMVALDELEARVAAGLGHEIPVPYYRMLNRRFVREML
ncbi:MAG: NUDIX hydrolase [Xanthobacteraceae bacterium]